MIGAACSSLVWRSAGDPWRHVAIGGRRFVILGNTNEDQTELCLVREKLWASVYRCFFQVR